MKCILILILLLTCTKVSETQLEKKELLKQIKIYYLFYQDSTVTIYHPHGLELKKYFVPTSKVYEDLAWHYNKKDESYIKFKALN